MKWMLNLVVLGVGLILLAGCEKAKRDLTPEEIWSLVSPSVVRVEAKSLEGDTMIGSGFVCELQGKKFILSNRHVVLGAKEVRVGSSEATLVLAPSYRISPELDLALIDLPPGLLIAPLKTRTDGVKIGERIFAIGFPLGLNKSITQGLISSDTEKVVQFDASISSGNSGGPLVDRDGAALGVVTAGAKSNGDEIAQNLNFAIKTAFVPKTELFQDPIVRFYDAWRALVKVENKLIDDIQDLRVFDVETCVQAEMAFPLGLAMDEDLAKFMAELDPEKKKERERLYTASYADELARVIQRHGSLEAGVKSVVAFLRSKILEFDKVPELFAGLGSDELLRSFGSDKSKITLVKWDIEPSEIVPLLKVSVEFAKAAYEDKAFQIDFAYELTRKLKNGDTNFIAAFQNADAKWVGERTTVRLPYDKPGVVTKDEHQVRMFLQCDQKFGHRSGGPKLSTSGNSKATQWNAEYGGFETSITSMFGQRAEERLQRGDVEGAIRLLTNEVEVKRYPDLGYLAILYACKGDFEKAYGLYEQAYTATLNQLNPFDLNHDNLLARSVLLSELAGRGAYSARVYPDRVLNNLTNWEKFAASKPAFLLTKMLLAEAIDSPAFRNLREFEQCWVLDAQKRSALADESVELSTRLSQFEKTVRGNPDAVKVYQKYFVNEPLIPD
jgi:hypothetical protein